MDSMGAVFDALGSATRRRMLDIIKSEPGCTVGQLAGHFDTTRVAVMLQLRILEDADLVISRKQGRERHLFHNVVPIQMVYDRWTTEYSAFWAGKLADVKYEVESQGKTGHSKGAQSGRAHVRVKGRHPRKSRGRVA